ncbi:endogenous retrovirus group K member 7 Gag polyprotein-like [Meriones unguiculatus]|uniref:endogenous retrovirus group K member 7 Gag polyprotein-like n=1 Tax=Meriones unguiculatus TaxID=10047 RepID=UPI00293F7444|nr:endogenous retrovirus group K member 7 Gag polyprotein-like [Meriones unguiculatus]
MGHSLSKEASFIKDLKASLRERGIRVKKKDLINFFIYIDKACPWFMLDGPTIHPKKWQKVGRELNQKLTEEGDQSLSPTVFSFWGIIRDIVEDADNDAGKRQLLSVAEYCLSSSKQNSPAASRPPSRASDSFSLANASPLPSLPRLYPPLPTADVPPPYSGTPNHKESLKSLGPPVSSVQDPKPLDPGDAAMLEDEAARYHNGDDPPLASAPPPSILPYTAYRYLSETRSRLSAKVHDMTEILHLQQQLSRLTTRCSALPTPNPASAIPEHSPSNSSLINPVFPLSTLSQLTFPVTTRSQASRISGPSQSTPTRPDHVSIRILDDEASDEQNSKSESDGEEGPQAPNSSSAPASSSAKARTKSSSEEPGDFHPLRFKKLEKLNSAVRTYGPNAPFTISLLESMAGGGFLTPSEWLTVVQSVLTRGQFLSWQADWYDRCRNLTNNNLKNPDKASAKWTFNKLTGQEKYAPEQAQRAFPVGLLAQAHGAALAAWLAIPVKGSVLSPLTKIIQGNNEDYSEFVGRLLEAAERSLGSDKIEQKESKLLKRLAFENANSACKAALRGKYKDKDLPEMIRICSDVDTFTHKMSQAISLVMGAAQGPSSKFPCFKCGQVGHFARQCPQQNSSPSGQNGGLPRPLPTTVCPRCRRGKHWAAACRSQTDAAGNPLPPPQGNMRRGQPRVPQPINFMPASGVSQPCHNQTLMQPVPDQQPAFAGPLQERRIGPLCLHRLNSNP